MIVKYLLLFKNNFPKGVRNEDRFIVVGERHGESRDSRFCR